MLQKLLQKNIVIIFSKEVIEKINEYITALTTYPISQNRMITKVDNLQNFLFSLGTSIKMPSICRYKDLGQVFNHLNEPLNENLRQVIKMRVGSNGLLVVCIIMIMTL